MNAVTQVIVTFVGSGIGAGVVTFALNFWKTERDFLRSELETLYSSVHTWTEETTVISALLMTGNQEEVKKRLKEIAPLS